VESFLSRSEGGSTEDGRMLLVLIAKSRHAILSSATTKNAGGLFFNQLPRHSLEEG